MSDNKAVSSVLNSVVIIKKNGSIIGTGFYVQKTKIITNYHVTENEGLIELENYSGETFIGVVEKYDIRRDLALIKTKKEATPLKIYNQAVPVGVDAIAVGHPKGLKYTMTKGVVSATREMPSMYDPDGDPVLFIQTDTAINSGNSGGPLIYDDFVIGINDFKFVDRSIEGLNFSIHYSELLDFLL